MPRSGSRVRVSFPAPVQGETSGNRGFAVFRDAKSQRMARWQSGHAAACKAVDAGSIPTLASIRSRFRRILHQLVSALDGYQASQARVAKSVDARDLKSLDHKPCRFESGLGHQGNQNVSSFSNKSTAVPFLTVPVCCPLAARDCLIAGAQECALATLLGLVELRISLRR